MLPDLSRIVFNNVLQFQEKYCSKVFLSIMSFIGSFWTFPIPTIAFFSPEKRSLHLIFSDWFFCGYWSFLADLKSAIYVLKEGTASPMKKSTIFPTISGKVICTKQPGYSSNPCSILYSFKYFFPFCKPTDSRAFQLDIGNLLIKNTREVHSSSFDLSRHR